MRFQAFARMPVQSGLSGNWLKVDSHHFGWALCEGRFHGKAISRKARDERRPCRRWIGVILLVIGLDQLTKAYFHNQFQPGERVNVLPFLTGS